MPDYMAGHNRILDFVATPPKGATDLLTLISSVVRGIPDTRTLVSPTVRAAPLGYPQGDYRHGLPPLVRLRLVSDADSQETKNQCPPE